MLLNWILPFKINTIVKGQLPFINTSHIKEQKPHLVSHFAYVVRLMYLSSSFLPSLFSHQVLLVLVSAPLLYKDQFKTWQIVSNLYSKFNSYYNNFIKHHNSIPLIFMHIISFSLQNLGNKFTLVINERIISLAPIKVHSSEDKISANETRCWSFWNWGYIKEKNIQAKK